MNDLGAYLFHAVFKDVVDDVVDDVVKDDSNDCVPTRVTIVV